jgi:GTPase-associated protein 1, N-terminal domain type 2/GTPase-associated protein 1, middle domain/GTPase-associated protein 1, C-terminal domain
MAFKQLYYTSCEHGLGGYSGYQFNAVTPGVSPAVMREVEDRTVYQPPGRLRTSARLDDAPDAYPIAFSYGASEATGAVITAQVVSAGTDYSGRPGNYFAHALVTDTPERDFGSLLPAELWRAGFWQRQPVAGTTLPELAGPPPRGAVDRAGIQTFLDSPGTPDILPQLLTAVGKAMAGDRPVLLASSDAGDSIWWIAAVSYLLGPHLARQLTFTTYSHRPAYTRYHLTGVLPESLPPDAAMSFQLFDLSTGQVPDGSVHPLAGILAGTSVMAAPGLWQQAAAFRPAPGPDFDGWLPPVTVAAGLLGRSLSPAETDEIARWLVTEADSLPEQLADAALSVTLAQPDVPLSSRRLSELLGVARRLPAPDRAGRLELMLAERALARLARGEPADPVELTGQADDEARAGALRLLGSAPPVNALRVLEWAAASSLSLPDAELNEYGRTRLDPWAGTPELAAVLSRSSAIRQGLVFRVAGEPPAAAEALFGSPAGASIGRDDLIAYPGLAELWLIHAAARGAIKPLRAFDEISDIRLLTHQPRRMDGELLRRLWPAGCPPEQVTALLDAVTGQPGPPDPDVLDWLTAEIGAIVARGMLDGGSLRLAMALAEHPVLPLLPESQQRAVRDAAHVEPLLREADEAVQRGDVAVFSGLFAAYAAVDGEGRRLLETQLPPLLAQAEPLGRALRGCPPRVAAAFCDELWAWLSPLRADVGLARRVFPALTQPDVTRQPALAEGLLAAFDRVLEWRRRDLGDLTRALEDDGLGQSFRDWRDGRRAGRKRWRFGGNRSRGEA